MAEPHPGFYLVETFEWMAGASYCQRLARIEDMLGWHFYDDAQWMNGWYMDHHDRPKARSTQ